MKLNLYSIMLFYYSKFSPLGKERDCYVESLMGKSILRWKINSSSKFIINTEGVNIVNYVLSTMGHYQQLTIFRYLKECGFHNTLLK